MENDKNLCILSLLVENKPGVLSRIVGLFSGRGYNIDSLNVAETMDASISRITLVTRGEKNIIEQIQKQLHKLINVIKVFDLTDEDAVYRELALVRVNAKADTKAEILRIIDIFRCKIIDVGSEQYTIQVSANRKKLSAILDLLKPFGIKEIVRTGVVALPREK